VKIEPLPPVIQDQISSEDNKKIATTPLKSGLQSKLAGIEKAVVTPKPLGV